jgi:hypothetical protein
MTTLAFNPVIKEINYGGMVLCTPISLLWTG